MTSPTLERAASAAYANPASFAHDCWVEPPDHLDLTSVVVDGHVNLVEIARAVLMAVRVPELSAAERVMDGCVKVHIYDNDYDVDGLPDAFTAMIDDILKEGE